MQSLNPRNKISVIRRKIKFLLEKFFIKRIYKDRPALFDKAWYLSQNPDVAASNFEPYRHYVLYGWKEGRNPHKNFSVSWYLSQNPDVSSAGIEPLKHYETFGWKENRNPNSIFNVSAYLEKHPELLSNNVEPYFHYLSKQNKQKYTKNLKTNSRNTEVREDHYRAYVGPPQYFDIVAAMTFNLLTCLGLRSNHRLLDIGCGSLRVGRLLIPYLEAGNYIGADPNDWLINDALQNEIGFDVLEIKKPRFIIDDNLNKEIEFLNIDFAIAQSVFSHGSLKINEDWIASTASHLNNNGILLATYFRDVNDYEGNEWVYPGYTTFRNQTMKNLVEKYGLKFIELKWAHPRQVWFGAYKDGFNTDLINQWPITWNRFLNTIEDPIYPMPNE